MRQRPLSARIENELSTVYYYYQSSGGEEKKGLLKFLGYANNEIIKKKTKNKLKQLRPNWKGILQQQQQK